MITKARAGLARAFVIIDIEIRVIAFEEGVRK